MIRAHSFWKMVIVPFCMKRMCTFYYNKGDVMIKKKRKKSDSSSKSLVVRVYQYRHIYVILLPVLLYYFIFAYLPIGGNLMAFQKYSITKGIWGSKWIGLDNFKSFLSSYNFWQLLRNTVAISVYNLAVNFPAPIILALLLNEVRSTRFKKIVQTITYMPHFISAVVICSMVLIFLSSEGLFNSIREIFGADAISFMTRAGYFRTIYVMMNLWQSVGWGSIIYIAAIAGIDQELYEAAAIDGAGRWKQALHVTLPGISETMVILLIMKIGQILSVGYEKILLLYNPTIYETADVISTYVYRRTLIEGGNYGYSTAISMFNSIINLILLISANRVSRKVSGSGLW